MLSRAAIAIALLAGVLFASAGRFDLPFVWAYIGLHVAGFVGVGLAIDPELLHERVRPGPGGRDRHLRWIVFGMALASWCVTGLDIGRYHWTDRVPDVLRLASLAGLLAAVEQQPAILFLLDEFGRFLRTIGDPKKAPHLFNVLGALMKLYSSADTVFRGKAYAEHKRNKVVDQPCVSVYGTTVPEHFFESLTPDSLSDGFIARLLVFEANATPPRQRSRQRSPPNELLGTARWWGDLKPGGNLRGEHPEPLVVPYAPEAGEIFDEFAANVDAELARPDSDGRSLWARAEEKACRLALVYACSADRDNLQVTADAAHWARDLVEYLTRRMLYVAHE